MKPLALAVLDAFLAEARRHGVAAGEVWFMGMACQGTGPKCGDVG